MVKLSKNFTQKELACRHCGEMKINYGFVEKLQKLRDEWGEAMIVNSWYRCAKHNKALGSNEASQHRLGVAVDIHVGNAADKYRLAKLAMKHKFKGIGIYKNFVHLDARQSNFALWRG